MTPIDQRQGPVLAACADDGIDEAGRWRMIEQVVATLAQAGGVPLGALPASLALDDVMGASAGLGLPIVRDGDRLVWRPAWPMLSVEQIREQAGSSAHDCAVQVLPLVGSSNECLKAWAGGSGGNRPRALYAECQWAGRGRRNRRWLSRFGESILMSLRIDAARPLSELPGIALVAGVAVADCLVESGVADVGLKWPNDLMIDRGKLGGILVEAVGANRGPSASGSEVVIGIGLNWRSPVASGFDPGQAACGLADRVVGSRDRIAGRLLAHLLAAVRLFASDGLAPFLPRYGRFDVLAGRSVTVAASGRLRVGVACGLTGDGALRVNHDEGEQCYRSAEVSVRESIR